MEKTSLQAWCIGKKKYTYDSILDGSILDNLILYDQILYDQMLKNQIFIVMCDVGIVNSVIGLDFVFSEEAKLKHDTAPT